MGVSLVIRFVVLSVLTRIVTIQYRCALSVPSKEPHWDRPLFSTLKVAKELVWRLDSKVCHSVGMTLAAGASLLNLGKIFLRFIVPYSHGCRSIRS